MRAIHPQHIFIKWDVVVFSVNESDCNGANPDDANRIKIYNYGPMNNTNSVSNLCFWQYTMYERAYSSLCLSVCIEANGTSYT